MAVRGSSTRGQAAAGQGRRRSRTSVWLTEREWAAVCAAAAVAGMKPGAWISATAVQAASRRNAGQGRVERVVVERLVEQLWQQRRVLANVGGNLNDLARVANSTGQVQTGTAATGVLRLVHRVVRDCDALLGDVREYLLGR